MLPLALYLAVAWLLFLPGALQPGSWQLPGSFYIGELNNVFLLERGLLEDHTIVFHTDWLNYPDGGVLVFIAWSNLIFTLLLEGLFSTLGAYNLSLIFILALAGWSGFLLARHLCQDEPAALVAGLLFGFNPFVLANVANGQLGYINHAWIALYVLCLLRWVEHGRWRDLASGALLAAVVLLNSPYFAVFCWLFTPVVPLWWLVRQPVQWRRILVRAGMVTAACALAQVPPYLYLRALETVPEAQHLLAVPLCEMEQILSRMGAGLVGGGTPLGGSAGLLALFLPRFDWQVGSVNHLPYLGFFSWLIVAASLWVGRRRGEPQTAATSPMHGAGPWLVGTLAFTVLALGPFLCLDQQAVVFGGGHQLPLPFLLLWKTLPFFHRICTPYRFAVMVALCLAVLAGLGLAAVRRRINPRAGVVLPVVCGALLLVDYTLVSPSPWPLSWRPLEVPSVYRRLAEDPDSYAIVELPYQEPKGAQFFRHDPSLRLPSGHNERLAFFQSIHRKKIPIRMAQFQLPPVYAHSPFIRDLVDLMEGRAPEDVVLPYPSPTGVPPDLRDCGAQPVDDWLLQHDFQALVLHESYVPPDKLACLRHILSASVSEVEHYPSDHITLYSLLPQ